MTGPLAGMRVLVPRPPGRAATLAHLLHDAGADVEIMPLISFEPPADPARLDLAVHDLAAGTYEWVALTSVTAVEAVLARAAALAVDRLVPEHTRVAVVGGSTAAAVRAAGLPVDLQPDGAGSAAELGRVWPAGRGGAVVLPRSALAAADLPDALRDKGWAVTEVDAYRTVVHPLPDGIAADLRGGGLHAVLLTSTSTVTALAGSDVAGGVVMVAIGEATAQAARTAGLPVHRVAERPSDAGLLAALLDVVRDRPMASAVSAVIPTPSPSER